MNAEPARLTPFHWLANERYAVLVTAAGGGVSVLDDYLLTAWRPDPIEGGGGLYIYVRDLDTREFWTAAGGPMPGQSAGHVVRQSAGLRIVRMHGDLESHVDVRLHGTAAIEQRVCTLTNHGPKPRHIELTSFTEVALNHAAAHEAHPAFSKLFVQTALLGAGPFLTAIRRPRGHDESSPILIHALLDATVTDFATDRARFIGRGRDLHRPQAMADMESLGRIHGNVLDPALSLRTVARIAPGATCVVRFVLGAGDSADTVFRQIEALRHASLDSAQMPASDGKAAFFAGDPRAELLRGLSQGLEPLAAMRVQPLTGPPPQRTSSIGIAAETLQFFNGHGGFTRDGREYVIRMPCDANSRPKLPPAPWINVIANPQFGCIVSETGAGAAWSRNSREYRLTPWNNDPVIDPHGDALYVRDETTGSFWSPMPGPAAPDADFEVHHGFGYSTWHHRSDDLVHETTVFVDETAPLRLTRVRITNAGSRPRRLALYGYNRWVLGSTPEATRSQVRTEFSPSLQAVLARNPAAAAGLRCVAFATTNRPQLDGWCADRATFLGVPGSPAAPAALAGDGTLQPGGTEDPCAVCRVLLDIAAGATDEVTFFLGAVESEAELATLLADFRQPGRIEQALQGARAAWQGLLARLQIETPSPGLNLMVNGWLPYQDIACRLWARSAFYQSGGAFGFRDQIQDAAAVVLLRPDLTRAQILLHAGHQFVEGDVLHWWHPPTNRGLRTRFADDLLWLPWITAYYVATTGDRALLDVEIPYLRARELTGDEAEVLLEATDSGERGDLYEHCCRALDRSLERGVHGLPLFGAGDWNDGMNRVGHAGRGESVWMGFFLLTVLEDFLPACALRYDTQRTERYRRHCDALRAALNADGWDGAWYRRGWYDSGALLGSKESDECRIDALVQAWAVISKAAPAERVEAALDSLEEHLVDDENRIVRLLTPPFIDTANDPGYIKGYVAGVRENGGQYTHAALWVVKALAEAGRHDRACEVLEWLLPLNHSLDRTAANRYKIEPYVVAADIYGAEPHVGRGGWSWYTGSAGWMYRVAVETLLGFSIEGGTTLCLRPRIPDAWPEARLRYAVDQTTRIEVDIRNPDGRAQRIVQAHFDGDELALADGAARVPLAKTGRIHQLVLVMGR